MTNDLFVLLQGYGFDNSGKAIELIAKGADVNARDEDGFSPLMYAAMYSHLEAVEAIISKGADINARDRAFKRTPLMFASQYGVVPVVVLLIANGADVNARDREGWTPLMWAAKYKKNAIALTLIAAGADINARSKEGNNALSVAVGMGNEGTAAILQAELDRLELTASLAKETQGTKIPPQSI